uniref:Uncharacterized protein n=1 Tax=viral metagenome TaxID=1070528 RepID=A0A6M3JY91_9ZZZZ
MEVWRAIEFLETIQKKDLFKETNKTAATFCCECKKNKSVGRYPFWHRFARTLCTECGKNYGQLLIEIGAIDKL